MNDPIAGDNVLLQHHLNTIDSKALTITSDLNITALKSPMDGARHNGLRALHWVQEVVLQKSLKNKQMKRNGERLSDRLKDKQCTDLNCWDVFIATVQ